VVLLQLKVARRLQTLLVSSGCASVATGVGLIAGLGAALIAAGVLAVAYGLLLVDDGVTG
jgi:hypothetical protein